VQRVNAVDEEMDEEAGAVSPWCGSLFEAVRHLGHLRTFETTPQAVFEARFPAHSPTDRRAPS